MTYGDLFKAARRVAQSKGLIIFAIRQLNDRATLNCLTEENEYREITLVHKYGKWVIEE